MIYSLNEVEILARKAARGAGLSWGMAEETGVAARWLVARRLPLALAGVLKNRAAFAPLADTEMAMNSACSTILCPLMTGIFLCDHSWRLRDSIRLNKVQTPLMLIPFIAVAADDNWVSLCWSGAKIVVGSGQLYLLDQTRLGVDVAGVTIAKEVIAPQNSAVVVADCGCAQEEEEWRLLESLAVNCYVSTSEESRRSGAGEQASDYQTDRKLPATQGIKYNSHH